MLFLKWLTWRIHNQEFQEYFELNDICQKLNTLYILEQIGIFEHDTNEQSYESYLMYIYCILWHFHSNFGLRLDTY
jgi:hypothetical protein